MKKFLRRVRIAWQVLIGQQVSLVEGKTQTIYVMDQGAFGKVVQIIPWRDGVLALDNAGRLFWLGGYDHPFHPFQKVQIVAESPFLR